MNDKVTLLITTFNRGRQLEKTLERLTHLTLPDEVLIVDDGSERGSDATEWVCKGYADRLPIKYIYNNNPEWSICSMARNIGVKNALGDTIITSEPELLWVTDIVPQMLKKREEIPNKIISIGTIYHMQDKTTLEDQVITDPKAFLESKIVEDYITEPRPYDQTGFVKTKNLQATFCALYERDWIMNVGGWDESFEGWGWDDIDLCTRLRIKGIGQEVDLEMEAIHQWHPHLPPHIQGPLAQKNEIKFQEKKLDDNPENPNLIANQGKEWGVIKE